MAEILRKNTESMIRELEDLRLSKILKDDTIRRIVVVRQQLESKINNGSKNIDDYRSYITHENLLLDKVRRDKEKISNKKSSVEFNIIQRLKRIYETALQRFPADYTLHEDFFKFSKKNNFTPKASQIVDKMIKMFSYKTEVWEMAAEWYRHLNNNDKALQILRKGLTMNPESTILYSAAIRLEINQISKGKFSTPQERFFIENKSCEKIETYVNLIFKNIQNLDFIISTLAILEGHNYTNPVQKLILDYLFQYHSREDVVWHMLAKREKKGMHFVSDPKEQRRTDSFIESCIMYCIDKYEQGLNSVAEEKKKKLWFNYLETLIEMQEENVQILTIDKEGLFKKALQKAHVDKCLEECHYRVWLKLMSDEDARNILREATQIFPQSEELFKMQLEHAIKMNCPHDVNVTFKLGVIALEEKALPLWLMILKYYSLIHTAKDTVRTIYEDGIKQSPIISNILKPRYIMWIAFHEDIDSARARYRTLALEKPYCKELHLMMNDLESLDMNPDSDRMKKVHELACTQFGEAESDVWINYIEFIISKKPADLQIEINRIYDESKNRLPPLIWQQFNEVYTKLLFKD